MESVPDMLVSAKSIAGGMPLAAVTGRAEIMDAPGVGGLGGTFGGNPCRARQHLLLSKSWSERTFLPGREAGGKIRRARARVEKAVSVDRRCSRIRRDAGDRIGASPETGSLRKQETEQVIRHCYEQGLIVLSAGTYGNVVRVLVPLVVTDEQFDEGLECAGRARLRAVAESSVETAPHRA